MGSQLTGRLEALPWGSVLFGFASRAVTAVVTLNFGSHELRFERGIVVGARAPVIDVDPVLLAIAFDLLGTADESKARHQIAAQPQRDAVDVIAELVALAPEETLHLHRTVLARRAAATFAVEVGSYTVEEAPPGSDAQGIEVQPIIYLGALLHAQQVRLVRELERLGDRFKLRPAALAQLERFGFTDGEQPIFDALAEPHGIPEIVAAGRPLGPQEVLSALYALATCDLCEVSINEAKQRSRVNSKVSFRKKPVAVAPPVGPPPPSLPAPRVSETFDLSAALSAELGDAPLAFEQEPPRAPVAAPRAPEPAPDDDDELEYRTTNVIEIPDIDPILLTEKVETAATIDDGRGRHAKRTQQLLAFVAVPRGPARKP